jgi:lipopolysaccharide/colanic/teichoic acid biosynthesis glycosyltransferase
MNRDLNLQGHANAVAKDGFARQRPAGPAEVLPFADQLALDTRPGTALARLISEFLRHLRREKRRAERATRPLSIVLYRIDISNDPQRADDDLRLVELLHACCRETDIVGHLADDLVAVLCTETDEPGVQGFIAKVEAAASAPWFTAVYATYPDKLFESLVSDKLMAPALHGLLVQEVGLRSVRSYRLKRPLDLVASLLLLALALPLMAVVALLVALTSPGPVIFRQQRLGQNGKPFTFYKFRSMRVNSDDGIHRSFVRALVRDGGSNGSGLYKLRGDKRITPVGRFIRKTSLDELPQLVNVLKGDMSLVGPRPPITYETEHYDAWHLRRLLSGKPGITGLWQVEGRSRVTFDEMVRMDLRYLRECSLALDLKILMKTVLVVLRCDGAV